MTTPEKYVSANGNEYEIDPLYMGDFVKDLADRVPAHTIGGLIRYVQQGVPTGEFLQAVLENDLTGAMGRADEKNSIALPYIFSFIYNCLPGACWGSKEKVAIWLARHEDIREFHKKEAEEVVQ